METRGRIIADLAHRQRLEVAAHQALHIVADDVQLAVVAAVEKFSSATFLAAERVIAAQCKKCAGADATGADHDIVCASGAHSGRVDQRPRSHSG
jgi:hypothetical protein